jgi:hypothetical protein
MRVTIIPSDGFVSVDNEGYSDLDLSFMDSDIHALQWYDTDGEIERQDNRGRIVANEEITDLTPYQPALDAWQAAKAATETAEQPLPADEPTPSE